MHGEPVHGEPIRGEEGDDALEKRLLLGVSRTFALTIPELPGPLQRVVTNGYLLCRLADTIEDEDAIDGGTKRELQRSFSRVVAGDEDPQRFAAVLAARLSSTTPPEEHELVRCTARVIRSTHSFPERERAALIRCVKVMCDGMSRCEPLGRGDGLADLDALHEYCYYVAGVVGEMLTEVFCAYSSEIEARRAELEARTVSFGQGLQMTNILKDVWEDRSRGFCWLPREVFLRRDFDLADLSPGEPTPAFREGMDELVGVALGHLEDALEYTLAIPRHERGIRRFCLWSLGMAVLTLRKIHRRLDYSSGRDVKITRGTVRRTVLVSNLLTRNDRLLRATFRLCATGLPRDRSGTSTR